MKQLGKGYGAWKLLKGIYHAANGMGAELVDDLIYLFICYNKQFILHQLLLQNLHLLLHQDLLLVLNQKDTSRFVVRFLHRLEF